VIELLKEAKRKVAEEQIVYARSAK
jgi:hypothetical protein